MKKKIYLITGSTGFIGSRLIDYLVSIDCNIRLLARKNNPDIETIICDFEKDTIPKSALDSVHTIIHLAGIAHDFRNQCQTEKLYNSVNIDFTIKLAKLASKNRVSRFLFISSVKAGGVPSSGRCGSEKEQSFPSDIYGKTKREAESQLIQIGRESEMHISIIRPALVYGPEVKGNLKLMMLGVKKGWFPPLPKVENKKSMIHVDDLVNAIFLVANSRHNCGEIFIATDGSPYSAREIYECMCIIAQKPIPKWTVPKAIFNIMSFISPSIKYKVDKLLANEYYSSSKLEFLGFKPKKTLKDMNEASF